MPWKTTALEDGRGAGLGVERELNSFYADNGREEERANEFHGLQHSEHRNVGMKWFVGCVTRGNIYSVS